MVLDYDRAQIRVFPSHRTMAMILLGGHWHVDETWEATDIDPPAPAISYLLSQAGGPVPQHFEEISGITFEMFC